MTTKWEYCVHRFDFNGFLVQRGEFDGQQFVDVANRLGGEGWELTNTFDTNFQDGDTRFIVAIFKRPD